jgi:hypothetical protein
MKENISIVVSPLVVDVPLSAHPYFAARTKRGKPYVRRARLLERYVAMGFKTYLEQRFKCDTRVI